MFSVLIYEPYLLNHIASSSRVSFTLCFSGKSKWFYKMPKIQASVIFSFVFLSVPKHSGRYLNKQLDHLQI